MAKPILLIEVSSNIKEDWKEIKKSYMDSTDNEYHVIVVKSQYHQGKPNIQVIK